MSAPLNRTDLRRMEHMGFYRWAEGVRALQESLRELQGWASDAFGPEGTEIPADHPITRARALLGQIKGT